MKFDMKQPCQDCPFLCGSSTHQTLEPGRVQGIIEAIREEKTFTCHKTLDLESRSQQFCGGALQFLERENRRTLPVKMAMAFGWYDPEQLKPVDGLIDTDGH